MITITKERLLTIKQWRETYGPGSNVVLPAEEAEELARIALVSLEAEPVAKIIAHYPLGVDVGKQKFVQAIGELPDFGGYLFAAPPAPVVPEEATPENVEMLSGYVSTYKLTDSERDIAAEIWNACRAAMLHGAEPVSQTYKSQHTQFEQVADLYEMQFDDGRTCAFHTDAQKAAQWLQACDGNRVQEYVKLERLRNALSGNYPVTPDGWISCSERMPENIPGSCKEYLVFDGLNNKVHHDYWVVPDGDSAPVASFWNHYGAHVTHWMPLPEPPQEAK
ncbi:TPA: DUF551 domain-containing protein [Escherichia coli]|nr:DUF551 domain-containing protein [Escherichia coli]HCB4189507.1 DUF551 domain-containing protein [Escherichia coli]